MSTGGVHRMALPPMEPALSLVSTKVRSVMAMAVAPAGVVVSTGSVDVGGETVEPKATGVVMVVAITVVVVGICGVVVVVGAMHGSRITQSALVALPFGLSA